MSVISCSIGFTLASLVRNGLMFSILKKWCGKSIAFAVMTAALISSPAVCFADTIIPVQSIEVIYDEVSSNGIPLSRASRAFSFSLSRSYRIDGISSRSGSISLSVNASSKTSGHFYVSLWRGQAEIASAKLSRNGSTKVTFNNVPNGTYSLVFMNDMAASSVSCSKVLVTS